MSIFWHYHLKISLNLYTIIMNVMRSVNSTNVSSKGMFMDSHIGDNTEMDNDREYIARQKEILGDRERTLHTYVDEEDYDNSDRSDYDIDSDEGRRKERVHKRSKKGGKKKKKKYDKLKDFQYRKGLLNVEKRVRHITDYINVNSAARRREPNVKYDKNIVLPVDPLKIESDKLVIDVGLNHAIEVGDKVTLSGLKYIKKILRTYTTYIVNNNDGSTSEVKKYAIDIVRGTDSDDTTASFMRFDIDNLNIDTTSINALSSTGYNSANAFFLDDLSNNLRYKEYDISYSDIYVDIDGFKTTDGSTKIGNIPINMLNSRHRVYFAPRLKTKGSNPSTLGERVLGITDTTDHPDMTSSSFYIRLDDPFDGDWSSINAFNVGLTFGYYGGIPVKHINSGYPITSNNVNGYYEVSKVYNTKIEITLDRRGFFTGKFGKTGLYLKRIKEIDSGYSNPNSYIIDLPKTFNNVVQARIISTEFPNYEKVFKANNGDSSGNNKLYWQNMDDGDKIYSLEIPSGSYASGDLQTRLEELFYQTPKIQQTDINSVFTTNNFVRVNINKNTDIVSFSSFKESIIDLPIAKIEPNIPESTGLDGFTASGSTFVLTINHHLHGLSAGDNIIIADVSETSGIPSSNINGEHTIKSIITSSSYTIEITNVNLNQVRTNTFGGNGVKIYIPNVFRMRFDFPDTMGTQLGFREAGFSTSITPYTTIVSNNDPYDDEISLDKSGNAITLKNNSLSLSGDSYILMSCEELNNVINMGSVPKIFSKINLIGLPGTIVYNTFVPTTCYYHDPIRRLTKLTLDFYSPSGEYFDFDGLDHSFMIEIVTVDEMPADTGMSSRLSNVK